MPPRRGGAVEAALELVRPHPVLVRGDGPDLEAVVLGKELQRTEVARVLAEHDAAAAREERAQHVEAVRDARCGEQGVKMDGVAILPGEQPRQGGSVGHRDV